MAIRFIKFLFIMWLFSANFLIFLVAQDNNIISSETFHELHSVEQIHYQDISDNMNIGWFVMNDIATEFIFFDNDYYLYHVIDGEVVEQWQYIVNNEQVFAVIDGTYFNDIFYILYTIDNTFWINDIELDIEGTPLAVGHDEQFLYLEVQVDNQLIVYQLDTQINPQSQVIIPNEFEKPVIRVGRIHIPVIVLTTFEGTVRAFDFDKVIGEYVVESPTVFGSINFDKTYMAWSDPNSTTLNRLNLMNGNNQVVAQLDNQYAQYYLLSHDASVIFAVNVDFEPHLIAWEVVSGERLDLGQYRDCNRIPDKVQLSQTGTSLVIGCDTGLDIWKVKQKGAS